MRKGASVAGAAAMAFLLMPAGPGAAAKPVPERNIAVKVAAPPQGINCTYTSSAEACFDFANDNWYVLDTRSNGRAAAAEWENELKSGSIPFFDWTLYRTGVCVNKLKKGKWGVCYKNYYESGTTNPYGYRGSRIRWRACDTAGSEPYKIIEGSCSGWTSWQDNHA